jgi:hypothetical protein
MLTFLLFKKIDFELTPLEIVHQYCAVGLFEEALFSAGIFQIDMTVIFTSMVDMCLRISEGGVASLWVSAFIYGAFFS